MTAQVGIRQGLMTDLAPCARAAAATRIVASKLIVETLLNNSSNVASGNAPLHLKNVLFFFELALMDSSAVTAERSHWAKSQHAKAKISNDLLLYVLAAVGEAYWAAFVSGYTLEAAHESDFVSRLYRIGSVLGIDTHSLPADMASIREWVLKKLAQFDRQRGFGQIVKSFMESEWFKSNMNGCTSEEVLVFVRQSIPPALAREL